VVENTIKNGQSREIGSIGYTRRRKTKQNITLYVLGTTLRKQKRKDTLKDKAKTKLRCSRIV